MPSPTSIDPRTLAKLQGLRLRARHIVEGYVAGRHHSAKRGFSTEFAEHREYAPGDDLRSVDWKAYGKTDRLFLKQYEDETNLACYLVLDVSESMSYRSQSAALSKLEYAQALAAALAWLVLRQQDAVGLVTFDSQIQAVVRPAGSPSQLEQIIAVLEAATANAKTSVGSILHELAKRFTRRGVVIVISDCFDDVNSLAVGLHHLRYRQHDVKLLQVLDPAELEFPFQRPTEFRGLEGLATVSADSQMIRLAYLEELAAFRQALVQTCRSEGIDYFLARTDEPLEGLLAQMLTKR